MNTEDYVVFRQAQLTAKPVAPTAPATPARPVQGPFAALQRLINTAGFVSVDLTDTVLASFQEQRDREARRYINYLE